MTVHSPLHFYIVDDDKVSLQLVTYLLESAGHKVTSNTSSTEAINQIFELQPDCVLSDLLMPELDGIELYHQIQKNHHIKQPVFIIITGKTFEYDKHYAYQSGVHGYLVKPVNVDTFVNDVLEIMDDTMTLQFWGIRGTLPVTGKKIVTLWRQYELHHVTYCQKIFFYF